MKTRLTPLIIGVTVIVGALILGNNIARINPNSTIDKTVSVSGQGEAFAAPDIYSFSITAQETGKTTKEVNTLLAQQIDAARTILKAANVDDKDIQSQNVSISENRVYNNSSSRHDGYRGSHTLNIKARHIEEVGPMLDHLSEIDGLLINGGSYSMDDSSIALQEARSDAFEKAHTKAQELANLAGMRLGKTITISEYISSDGGYAPVYAIREMAMADNATSSTSINPGEQKLSVTVDVMFELK